MMISRLVVISFCTVSYLTDFGGGNLQGIVKWTHQKRGVTCRCYFRLLPFQWVTKHRALIHGVIQSGI